MSFKNIPQQLPHSSIKILLDDRLLNKADKELPKGAAQCSGFVKIIELPLALVILVSNIQPKARFFIFCLSLFGSQFFRTQLRSTADTWITLLFCYKN